MSSLRAPKNAAQSVRVDKTVAKAVTSHLAHSIGATQKSYKQTNKKSAYEKKSKILIRAKIKQQNKIIKII